MCHRKENGSTDASNNLTGGGALILRIARQRISFNLLSSISHLRHLKFKRADRAAVADEPQFLFVQRNTRLVSAYIKARFWRNAFHIGQIPTRSSKFIPKYELPLSLIIELSMKPSRRV